MEGLDHAVLVFDAGFYLREVGGDLAVLGFREPVFWFLEFLSVGDDCFYGVADDEVFIGF